MTRLTPARAAVLRFLGDLENEAVELIDDLGGMHGAVLPRQRPWSWALDQIAAERETA